jgi:ubiquinone biosynthesis protein COQ4
MVPQNIPNGNEPLTSEVFNIEELRALPVGTFGRAVADFIDRNDLSVVTTRDKLMHDFVHVLTGYNSTPIGENEIIAFFVGSKFAPKPLFFGALAIPQIIYKSWAAGFLQLLYKSGQLREFIGKRMWRAYQLGRQCGFNPATCKPELFWTLPVSEVKALYPGLT